MRQRVTDVDDPRLADYTRLTDVKLRTSLEAAHGLFIAEGTKVISRAVAAGYPVRSVLVTERRLGGLIVAHGIRAAGDRSVAFGERRLGRRARVSPIPATRSALLSRRTGGPSWLS
jgi:hypothetical protein